MHASRTTISVLAVLILTADHCQRQGSTVQGNRFDNKHHHYVPLHTDATTDNTDIAWIVQTGESTAREAVVAMLLTTLQHQHNRTGLVADVDSEAIVPLVDTGHTAENWSRQYWAAELAQLEKCEQPIAVEAAQIAAQTHPKYYEHCAHKVLPGYQAAYTRWPTANWYIMIDDDTYVFQKALRNFLSQFDPSQEHYLGYPTRGVQQCRDPTEQVGQQINGFSSNFTDNLVQHMSSTSATPSSTEKQPATRQLLDNNSPVDPQHSQTQPLATEAAQQHSVSQQLMPAAVQPQQGNQHQKLSRHATDEQVPTLQDIPQHQTSSEEDLSHTAQQHDPPEEHAPTDSSAQHTSSEETYALGGGGTILSRAAMAKVAPALKGCMLSSQDCYMDDLRLYFCLKEVGIRLNASSNYDVLNFTPNSNIDWGTLDPCLQPAVFHGVTPMAMHMLWEAEQQHRGNPTMADLFAHISLWGEHSERPGQRYSTKHMFRNVTNVIDKRTCREICEQHPGCKAWNFNRTGHYCELLDKLSKPAEQWRFVSGVSQPAYVCLTEPRIAEQ